MLIPDKDRVLLYILDFVSLYFNLVTLDLLLIGLQSFLVLPEKGGTSVNKIQLAKDPVYYFIQTMMLPEIRG